MNSQELFDSYPVSEGMQYGPFAPPELNDDRTARWVMDESKGDNTIYQLSMLRDSLIDDRFNGDLPDDVYTLNIDRLNQEIARQKALRQHIPELRAVIRPSRNT